MAKPITGALATQLHVVSVDYRAAPEHPYPAAVADAMAVYTDVVAEGRPVALAGDSAGGGIALAAALELTRRGDTIAPTAVALLSPHLDHGDRALGRVANSTGPEDDQAALLHGMLGSYRGDLPVDHPGVSPLRADRNQLAALPPVLVQTGTADGLHHQALALARRIREVGGRVDLDVWVGLGHTWHYHPDLPEAGLALAELAASIERVADQGRSTAWV